MMIEYGADLIRYDLEGIQCYYGKKISNIELFDNKISIEFDKENHERIELYDEDCHYSGQYFTCDDNIKDLIN